MNIKKYNDNVMIQKIKLIIKLLKNNNNKRYKNQKENN